MNQEKSIGNNALFSGLFYKILTRQEKMLI